MKTETTRHCANCSEPFSRVNKRTRFCSMRCANFFRPKKTPEQRAKRKLYDLRCIVCETSFQRTDKDVKSCSLKCARKADHGTVEERFHSSYVKEESGCWTWTGGANVYGYGRISINRKRVLAHRLSFELHKGSIKSGLLICHHCDNPICVNPEHLFEGTHQQNMSDCASKGRQAMGEHSGVSKLTDQKVREIISDNRLHREIAPTYGVSSGLISMVKNRLIWKHVMAD